MHINCFMLVDFNGPILISQILAKWNFDGGDFAVLEAPALLKQHIKVIQEIWSWCLLCVQSCLEISSTLSGCSAAASASA